MATKSDEKRKLFFSRWDVTLLLTVMFIKVLISGGQIVYGYYELSEYFDEIESVSKTWKDLETSLNIKEKFFKLSQHQENCNALQGKYGIL